jgi:hypothetical protein
MSNLSACCKLALSSLAFGAALVSAPVAHADDFKHFNAATICAPYTSSAPDYATLRFRAEGIINDSDTSKFVICNIPRDSEAAWDSSGSWAMAAFFRRTTSGTPAITSNQCTLTVGFNLSEPLQSKTYSAIQYTSTYGAAVMQNDTPSGDYLSYATLVCRIAPGSLMDLVQLVELGPTDTPSEP